MNDIEKRLLEKLTGLHKMPSGAFNIRKNGAPLARESEKDIEIIPTKKKSGIDIIIKDGVQN